ncbi:MAG: L-histidine N(alpha)-methyltransferase [Gammaproteobacteria bacterium]|nr:L-histidine N(alpha)-methyltransferase [Gammaproteobacteria bacterium]
MSAEVSISEFEFYDLKPTAPCVQDEVIAGLNQSEKTLPPKYFYDERGSELFEEITELPEYYLTRTETGILQERSTEFQRVLKKGSSLLEYGVGSGKKSRILLDAIEPTAYVPVDISSDPLLELAHRIREDYLDMSVYPICADFTNAFELPSEVNGMQKVAFFPGSSIGNFLRSDACEFVSNVAKVVGEEGFLILGVDTRKPASIIEPAYNDSRGVTAKFNKNMLNHLNNLLGANFRLDLFDHRAHYLEDAGCVEMHLVCRRDHEVEVGDETFLFREGESICTERSYKYSGDEVEELASQAGFALEEIWTDVERMFIVALMRCKE